MHSQQFNVKNAILTGDNNVTQFLGYLGKSENLSLKIIQKSPNLVSLL